MLDFIESIKEREAQIASKEQCLGKSLYQPFTDANSGARKIMAATQLEHAMPLIHSEVAILKTGYEEEYGDQSSAIIRADSNYEVVGKISKFADNPNHHYYLLLRDILTNKLYVLERIMHDYSTETYGYLYDNTAMDALDVGYEIATDDVLRKSTSTDEYLNRQDGVNLNTIYMACDITKEDGMWISEPARRKLASPLFKKVVINLNDNDMFLNIMGDENNYKSFPMIGEEIQNGMLCAIRREQSDTSLFTQSVQQLMTPMMSDEKYTIKEGKVIDISIKCNNPDILKDKHTNCEVLYYYNNWVRFMTEFVNTVDSVRNKYNITEIDYTLEKMYVNFKRELRGDQFIDDGKIFSGSYIEFMILEYNLPSVGDKITNRFGGKGVIVRISPEEEMPRTADTNEPVELIMNGCTCVNRENPGQAHEMSITHINRSLINFFRTNMLSTAEIMNMVVVFLSYTAPKEAVCMADYFNHLSDEDKDMFVQQFIDDGFIQLSIKPISESMTQDRLNDIYKEFSWINQRAMVVPQKGSTGKIRYIYSRRPVVFGKMYIYRLKQYAEEKYSITSLSSTNLRGENSRNKLSKNYKALHQATPVQFGYMETDDFGHLGFEHVIETMMIHSLSPAARKLTEKFYVDDPYNIDIKLDSDSKNRSAEQVNVYLKAIGYKLLFTKVKKKMVTPFTRPAFIIHDAPKAVIKRVSVKENFDIDKWIDSSIAAEEEKKKHAFSIAPFMIGKKD